MPFRVPFVDPVAHYARLKGVIDQAIVDCLSRGDLIYRQQLRDFEEHLAAFVGVKYAVGVNSGYHALHFSLLASGIGAGDEVITAAHTFVATVSAIIHCGAWPVLVDIQDDYDVDPEAIARAVTPRTKAVIPVHLNGRMCDMDAVMTVAERRGLVVIEDAAQALGATYNGRCAGSLGAAGCFSFYPFKILGGFGDGGAITTNDAHVARVASLLRYNGEDRETGEYHYHGYTALLDNVQAAVLDLKLRYLPEWIEHRRTTAERYRQGLEAVTDLGLPHFSETRQRDVYQNYVIRTAQRDALRRHLHEAGIQTLVHWPKPMWEHKGLGLQASDLPRTERACREVLSLPMSAETTSEHVDRTVAAIQQFFSSRG